MIYQIYTLIYILALIFLFPFEYLKRPVNIRKRWVRERTGIFSNSFNDKNPSVWIHAVSVGEVISTVTFVRQLKESYPDIDIIVSTVTDTGQKVAKDRLTDIARIIYMPFDMPIFIKRTLDYFKPSLMIIMETEIWPNIIREFKKRGIPVVLVNGRISEKSFKGYKKLGFFMREVMQNIDKFCMQNEIYAERIRNLGAVTEKVKVTGNFKFDIKPPAEPPEWTKLLNGRVIVAGSTHNPEEDIITSTYMRLNVDFPELILILAPRHPERFKVVEELLKKKDLKYFKRSDLSPNSPLLTGSVVVILDVIGELASVYGVCDIALIGGSFIKHGGQNPLEPAYWSKAIVCGRSMENFPFIEEFYQGNAALKTDEVNLYSSIYELLQSPERLLDMGRKAKRLYEKNAGATNRVLDVMKKYLH